MRSIPVLLGTMLLLPSFKMPAQRVAADGAPQTFEFLADQYFNEVLFRFSPTGGTAAGLHQYDTQLEDYSAGGIQQQIAALHTYEGRIAAIDPAALDAPVAGDRQILLNSIRSSLLTLEVIRPWEKNPDNYSSGLAGSVFVIMSRNYAPANTRLKAVVAREQKMPAVLMEARRNLKNPPKIYTEIALEQIDGIVSFFQNDVPSAFLDANDAATRAAFQKSNAAVVEGARKLCRVDEVRPAGAFERRLQAWRGYLRKEAELRRDG